MGIYFGRKKLTGVPLSDDCPFFANPPVVLRSDILVLSRFILFGIVIIFTWIFICAVLLAERRARRVRGSIIVAYRTNNKYEGKWDNCYYE